MVRLALVYTLLDGQTEIGIPHLRAALAVWEFCEASAAFIFGDSLGDEVADDILRALQLAGSAGLTRTAIRDHLGRNRSADRIGAALALLMNKGKATAEIQGLGWASDRGVVRVGGGVPWVGTWTSLSGPIGTT